jgi:hypothetical protein
MEELLRGDGGPIERGREDDVDIEECERGNQKILLIEIPEMERLGAVPFHEPGTGQHHRD